MCSWNFGAEVKISYYRCNISRILMSVLKRFGFIFEKLCIDDLTIALTMKKKYIIIRIPTLWKQIAY